jgi:sulfite oxidase
MSALVHKSADFVFHQEVPPNGGPPLNRLIEEFVTPESNFFLRTHGDIPNLDHSVYRLTVSGRLSKTYQFSLKDLSEHFSQKEITATLHAPEIDAVALLRSRRYQMRCIGETTQSATLCGRAVR